MAAAIAILLLPQGLTLHARLRQAASYTPRTDAWQRVNLKIIARGSNVKSSTGNMDSYLAIVPRGKSHEETVSRLVHYYPSFQVGIRDEQIASGGALHLRVTPAEYCRMDAKDFLIQHVFDEDAVARIREPGADNILPCLLVRE
jgi:hypothetical protein